MSLHSKNSQWDWMKFIRNGVLIAALATGVSAQADDALKTWVEATATSGGIVPSLTLRKSTSDTTQVGWVVGLSPTQKDAIGVFGISPTPESAMAIYGWFGQITKDGKNYDASWVGMKYNYKLNWWLFDAIGFGVDTKNVNGATLWNSNTQTRSGFETTVTTATKEQPKTNISTLTVGGVKYTESGAWAMNVGPSSLNGKTGVYAGVNYFSNSWSSAGLSIQHGAVMANAGIDVSGVIAKTLNATLGTQYAISNSESASKLSLLDITVEDSMKSGRLVWLSSLMPEPTTTTNSVKTFDLTKPFVVDSTNIVKNPDGTYSINIVPSLRQSGATTLPSSITVDLSSLLKGATIQSVTASAPNWTAQAGFVQGTNEVTFRLTNTDKTWNIAATINTSNGTERLIIKTLKGQL